MKNQKISKSIREAKYHLVISPEAIRRIMSEKGLRYVAILDLKATGVISDDSIMLEVKE